MSSNKVDLKMGSGHNESGTKTTFTYVAASRLTTSIAGTAVTTYPFDANGSQTNANAAGTITTMVYDFERRMVCSTNGAVSATITYSGEGYKRSTQAGGTTTAIIWDGLDILQERSPGVVNLLTVDSQTLSVNNTSLNQFDFVVDQLDSLTGLMDLNSEFFATWRWSPNGQFLNDSYSKDLIFNYGWVGSLRYMATGLRFSEWYVRARNYSTPTSQWLSEDGLWPVERSDAYASGRTTLYGDPSRDWPNHSCFEWVPGTPGTKTYVGTECSDYMVSGDTPGQLVPVGKCKTMCEQLSKCPQKFGCEALRESLGGGPGGASEECRTVARGFGVNANCLCALAITERSYQNRSGLINSITEGVGIGGRTIDCLQLDVDAAKGYLESFLRCNLTAFEAMFLRYPYSRSQLRNLLHHYCGFSMKVGAAFIAANSPPCSLGNYKHATLLWIVVTRQGKPKNPKSIQLFDCTWMAFYRSSPCG